jgi:hypothetical protein
LQFNLLATGQSTRSFFVFLINVAGAVFLQEPDEASAYSSKDIVHFWVDDGLLPSNMLFWTHLPIVSPLIFPVVYHTKYLQ